MSNAILFSAFGEKFVKHAIHCSRFAKSNTNDVDVVLHTTDRLYKNVECLFDRVIYKHNIWRKTFTYRIYGMIDILKYYEKIIYVDNDVIILSNDFTNIYQVLDNHDVAVTHAKHRHSEGDLAYSMIPECYPEFNCGVIGYTRNSLNMLKDWVDIYNSNIYKHPMHHRGEMHDQGAFREVVYKSGLRVCTLPERYNCKSSTATCDMYAWHHKNAIKKI